KCLVLFDKCFNAVTDKDNGLQGYIERFEKNKLNFPKLKNKILDFILVDGSAAAGATRQVRNCYEEIKNTRQASKANSLGLMRQLMRGYLDKKEPENRGFNKDEIIMGWTKADSYLGHMD